MIFLAVCLIAVIGYLIAGWHLGDSVYMVIITIFGVGYGEVQPIDSWPLRSLTIIVIIGGYGAVIYTVGGFIQMVVDGELNDAFDARRTKKEIDAMDGHTIICGFGRMGTSLAGELHDAGRPFVAIDSDPVSLEHARMHGWSVLAGDATDEDVLEEAGVRRAQVLATVLSDDATNVFVTLTARSMNPDLTIIARGENRSTQSKLVSCGADEVVMPTAIGATRISQLIMKPSADQVLDRLSTEGQMGVDLEQIGLEFDELIVAEGSALAGRTLAEVEVRGAHGYLIVGIRGVDGTTALNPGPDTRLAVGDAVLVLGYRDDIPSFAARFSDATPPGTSYRGVRMDR